MSVKYRVFTNDVGPNAYSALRDITAESITDAKRKAKTMIDQETKALVLPHTLRHLWPDGISGRIKTTAQGFVVTK